MFIPIAEATGLIVPLGLHVLEIACKRALEWQGGEFPVQVAVNVSAVQFFRDDFVESVRRVLAKTGLAGDLLEFELTESVLLPGVDQTIMKMNELRAMGVSLSIDDFGTGYSSLSYLGRLPFSALKIDRSFVQELNGNPCSGRMIETIVALAHIFDMTVTVEGVETAAQLQAIQQFGCKEAQGYLLGRPTPFPERFLRPSATPEIADSADLARLSLALAAAEIAYHSESVP
jgi:EAL domain-containing protein (putative c-di-GMP-specific phosphodiesterase class I)